MRKFIQCFARQMAAKHAQQKCHTTALSAEKELCGENSLTRKIHTRFLGIWQYLFFEGCSLTHGRIQDLLADTQVLRGYLKQLVGIDELQALLQTHDFLRNQL